MRVRVQSNWFLQCELFCICNANFHNHAKQLIKLTVGLLVLWLTALCDKVVLAFKLMKKINKCSQASSVTNVGAGGTWNQ